MTGVVPLVGGSGGFGGSGGGVQEIVEKGEGRGERRRAEQVLAVRCRRRTRLGAAERLPTMSPQQEYRRDAVRVRSSAACRHDRQVVAPTAFSALRPLSGPCWQSPTHPGTLTPSLFCCPISLARLENATLLARVLIQSPTVRNDPRCGERPTLRGSVQRRFIPHRSATRDETLFVMHHIHSGGPAMADHAYGRAAVLSKSKNPGKSTLVGNRIVSRDRPVER